MSKKELIDHFNTFTDDELCISESKLFHKIVAEGEKDILNLSVLSLNKVRFSEFPKDMPDLCRTA